MRKSVLFVSGLCVLLGSALLSASAQVSAAGGLPAVPTTKVLAVGRLTAGTARDSIGPVMMSEVRATVRLYLSGKIDQWYVRQDKNGVVFVMNVSTVEEARSLLEKLPLGEAKLMEFDLIPLGPLSPLQILLSQQAASAPAK